MPPLRPALLLLTLLALLAGCGVYEGLVHPYRLPTPPLSPELKRQMKAKQLVNKNRDKARRAKKPKSADPEATAAADADPPAKAAAATDDGTAAAEPKAHKHSALYDKKEMLKKPKLLRRRYHKPTGGGSNPLRRLQTFFKSKLRHGKPKPKPKAAPADDAASPAPEPDPNTAPDK